MRVRVVFVVAVLVTLFFAVPVMASARWSVWS
jgi:hypothetical protein